MAVVGSQLQLFRYQVMEKTIPDPVEVMA